ncbi:hypothetical protein CENTIMANUS_00333 [Klebsiella phage vB_KpM_Centimanus]
MENESLLEKYRTALNLIEKDCVKVMYDENSGQYLFVAVGRDEVWELLSDLYDPKDPNAELIDVSIVEKINQPGEILLDDLKLLREYKRLFWLISMGVVDFCFAEDGEVEGLETDYSLYTDFDGKRIFLLFVNDSMAETPIGKRQYQKRGLKTVYVEGGLGAVVENECAFREIPVPGLDIKQI